MNLSALAPAFPEIVLALGALILLVIGAYSGDRATGLVSGASVLLLVAAGVLVALMPQGKNTTFSGSFVVDDYARFFKLLALTGSAVTVIL